jgi:hypothetical protein
MEILLYDSFQILLYDSFLFFFYAIVKQVSVNVIFVK